MNDLTPFQTATPAMIVGRAIDGGTPPLGLGEPFALKGGGRLGPAGIAFDLMHEHQTAFLRWASESCKAALASGRFWFRGTPVLLTGPAGAGRLHAARRLAHVAGVQHVVINLTDPLIAANIASSGRVTEAMWASPITVAMAAKRCANPVATVIGIDRVDEDVAAGLVSMIDPLTNREWIEDRLGTYMDFGEVTWILPCDDLTRVPTTLRQQAAHVAFQPFPANIQTTAALSILLEVLDDLGLDAADPAFDWPKVARHIGGYSYSYSAKRLYAQMVDAVTSASRGGASEPDADSPF